MMAEGTTISEGNLPVTVMAIAGSDPTGAAGIMRDCLTFHDMRAQPVGIITAVTAQNSSGLFSKVVMSPEMIELQAAAIISEYDVSAVKIGMLGNRDVMEAITEVLLQLPQVPVVFDPVLRSSSGFDLYDGDYDELAYRMFPLVSVVTPNISEAEVFSQHSITDVNSMKEAARIIGGRGAPSVIVKGGHCEGDECPDVLYTGGAFHVFPSERKAGLVRRGKGCIFSSALAVRLGRGFPLERSVQSAKSFVFTQLS